MYNKIFHGHLIELSGCDRASLSQIPEARILDVLRLSSKSVIEIQPSVVFQSGATEFADNQKSFISATDLWNSALFGWAVDTEGFC
jgi:hypothetical protein